jgi:hypothetical protein
MTRLLCVCVMIAVTCSIPSCSTTSPEPARPYEVFAKPCATADGKSIIIGLYEAGVKKIFSYDTTTGNLKSLFALDVQISREKAELRDDRSESNYYRLYISDDGNCIAYHIECRAMTRFRDDIDLGIGGKGDVLYVHNLKSGVARRFFENDAVVVGRIADGHKLLVSRDVGYYDPSNSATKNDADFAVTEIDCENMSTRDLFSYKKGCEVFSGYNLQELHYRGKTFYIVNSIGGLPLPDLWCWVEGSDTLYRVRRKKDLLVLCGEISSSSDGQYVACDDGLVMVDLCAFGLGQGNLVKPKVALVLPQLMYHFEGWSPNGELVLFSARYDEYEIKDDGSIVIHSVKEKDPNGMKGKLIQSDKLAVYNRQGKKVFTSTRKLTNAVWLADGAIVGYDSKAKCLVKVRVPSGEQTIMMESLSWR